MVGAMTERVLMGPGPSNVPAAVLEALSQPTIGHLDPVFLRVLDETQGMLRQVFGTENALTLPMSATGSAGMETCFVNLLEPGDHALICRHGVFGGRMAEVARRCGAEVTISSSTSRYASLPSPSCASQTASTTARCAPICWPIMASRSAGVSATSKARPGASA